MASLYPHEVRQAVAARVASLATPSAPLRESVEPFEFIRAGSRSPVHLEFAVGLPRSAAEADRQRAAAGVVTQSDLRVGFFYQLKPKDRLTSWDDARTVEATIRNALMAKGWTDGIALRWVDAAPIAAATDGWLWLEQSFAALHHMPLV